MFISQEETRDIIQKHLTREFEEPHLDLIVDLTCMSVLIHELAFQCAPEIQENKKNELLEFVAYTWKNLGELQLKTKFYEISISCGSEERIPDSEDLFAICLLSRSLTTRAGGPSKEALTTWIKKMWEDSVRQQHVYNGNEEGNIQSKIGVVKNIAASLALFGARKGLLPS